MIKVDFYSVEVKYTGDFEDYTQADWRAKAEYECDHGVDPYDYTKEVVTFEEGLKLEEEYNYVADNRYPCNKLAYVTWAAIREQDDEDEETFTLTDEQITEMYETGYISTKEEYKDGND